MLGTFEVLVPTLRLMEDLSFLKAENFDGLPVNHQFFRQFFFFFFFKCFFYIFWKFEFSWVNMFDVCLMSLFLRSALDFGSTMIGNPNSDFGGNPLKLNSWMLHYQIVAGT